MHLRLIVIFLIIVMMLYVFYDRCSFQCADKEASSAVQELQELKKMNLFEDVDEEQLKMMSENKKIQLAEINEKEGFYPLWLYNWRPYGYHFNYYPYRRYLRPRGYYHYPGKWVRHYGNYYYVI